MSDRLSFLVFCTDQHQSYSVGCNGNPDVRTPHIDRIARHGITFNRAYCSNPICMPSRSSLITGLSPRQHGCLTNGMILPDSVPTVTQALSHAGYRTHAIGKLHFQPFEAKARNPGDQERPFSWEDGPRWRAGQITGLPNPYYGFQSGDYVGGHVNYCFGDHVNWLHGHHPGVWERYGARQADQVVSKDPPCWKLSIPQELHYNTWITERTMAFLDGVEPGQHFFLWCSFPDPHFPYAACKPYSNLYDPASLTISPTWDLRDDPCSLLADYRANWGVIPEFGEATLREVMAQTYGMITHIDDCVGRVVDHLERRGLAQDTVVVFLSDHGEYLGTHHLLYKGAWPYEELYRVPFIWKVPNGRAQECRCQEVVSLLDFAPTVLDYAGVDETVLDAGGLSPERPYRLPGRSLRKFLDNGEPLDERRAIVEAELTRPGGQLARIRTIVEGRHKLTVYAPTGEAVLRDLLEDPEERRNLWDDQARRDVQAHLVHALVEELSRTDRLGPPRIGFA